ncbi:MAG TPA: ABC transporter ATP-binding protein [Thermoguttaceae bacterium]|nr:ABC transporter ATP-binding protein [Thermoguttaceae bacterium]
MIQIHRLNFSVGNFALKDVSLHVEPGEYFVVLGPSGSGKTLLMECLCGLNRIHSGEIAIDGRDVTRLEPRNRGIGYVPQDYALFPHRTVRQNVCFGLETAFLFPSAFRRLFGHRPEESISARVTELIDSVGISHLVDRLPGKLSGGEKQRVALARALAIEPKVLVLDEPVSALDEQTRDALCRQLKRVHRSTGTTTIHICHNFAEMMTVADRVGIIHQGRILQVGTPQEILQRPNSTRVARFVQAGNLFPARAQNSGPWTVLNGTGAMQFRAPAAEAATIDGQVTVMVRPENIRLEASPPENPPPGTTVLEGSIRDAVDLGPTIRLSVACGNEGEELEVSLGKKEYHKRQAGVGDRVFLLVAPQDIHLMRE